MKQTLIAYVRKDMKMDNRTIIYGYCLLVRNKLVWCLDWLLMRIHTVLSSIEHDGADSRVKRNTK